VIVGPTAVGKTAVCIELAKKYDCSIISADSRQFFRQMNIGTAKPTPKEMHGVKHHFIDFLNVDEEMSAGRYEEMVLKTLTNLFQTRKMAILTGGSGLYVQAVCKGMSSMPVVPKEIREKLMLELETNGLQHLLEELRIKDPDYYEYVDKNNFQRIVRALEMIRYTKKPFSSFRDRQSSARDFQIIKIGLELEREKLYKRIDERVDQMLEKGLLKEIEGLYPLRHLNSLQTVGYKEFFAYFDGEHDLKEATRLVKRNTRRYAKRQLTWFRKDEEIIWFRPGQVQDIMKHIDQSVVSN